MFKSINLLHVHVITTDWNGIKEVRLLKICLAHILQYIKCIYYVVQHCYIYLPIKVLHVLGKNFDDLLTCVLTYCQFHSA